MLLPTHVAVGICRESPGDEQINSTDWLRICQVTVYDPRLAEYEKLMANKAERAEPEALRYNAELYLDVVDGAVEEALYDIIYGLDKKLEHAVFTAGVVMFIAVALQAWPVTVMLTLLGILLTLNWWSSRRCRFIRNYLASRQENFNQRLEQLCESWLPTDSE